MFKVVFSIVLSVVIYSCNDSNNIAIIDYEYTGCFAAGKSKLVIYKEGKNTIAKLEQSGQNLHIAELNTLQLDTFNIFIKQLKNRDFAGLCTTQEHYVVKLNREVIDKTDGTCHWNGFNKLLKCFLIFPSINASQKYLFRMVSLILRCCFIKTF